MTRVLITGASGAFGNECSESLRTRGATVKGLDLQAGDGVLECDITSWEAASAGVEEAVKEMGGLDVLVNNAGIGGPASAGAPPDERARARV